MPPGWPPFEVTSSRQKLSDLRNSVEKPLDASGKTLPSEIIGSLSRLLIIRACGHLEQVVGACTRGYIESKSGGPVRAFSLSWSERSKNPSRTNLEELLGRFDAGWLVNFQNLVEADDERLHRGLASAVDKRNRIAHGENEGANRDQALRLCEVVEEIADWWSAQFRPF